MAVFHGVIRSKTLAMDTSLSVILPYDRPSEAQESPCKTLYLLHGLGDNADAWCRYTRIESYARDRGLAVIMPEVQRSFYFDMPYGLKYFTYITEELPRLCGELFQISTKRQDSFVAGLSMGGYGALKCGLSRPDRYAGCASFSGCVDIRCVYTDHYKDEHLNQYRAVFGDRLEVGPRDDLYHLAGEVSSLPRQQQPRLYFSCGQQDFLHGYNLDFKSYLDTLPLAFRYEEWPGDHNWFFWDESIAKALDYLLA